MDTPVLNQMWNNYETIICPSTEVTWVPTKWLSSVNFSLQNEKKSLIIFELELGQVIVVLELKSNQYLGR